MSPADAARNLRDVAYMVPGTRAATAIRAAANMLGYCDDSPGWLAGQRSHALECHVSPDEIAALDLAIEALS